MRVGARRAVLGVTALIALVGPPVASGQDADYLALLASYPSDPRGAITALDRWTPDELESIVSEAARAGDAVRPRRGALLHTERAIAAVLTGDWQGASRHLTWASRYVGSVAEDDWVRRREVALGNLLLMVLQPGAAEATFERAAQKWGEDPDIALGLGVANEELAAIPLPAIEGRTSGNPNSSLVRVRKRERAERYNRADRAKRLYRSVIERNGRVGEPRRAEARLRLGRLEQRLGRADEAERWLSAPTEDGARDDVRYLAALFRGRVAEARGALRAAAAAYAEAVGFGGRSAWLALAHVRHVAGDERGAGEAVSRALVPSDEGDPVRYYPRPTPEHVNQLFLDLRRDLEP